MAFSIDWFMTVPGILITIGVILLIIALILFIVSSMKEKKGEKAPSVLENGGNINSSAVQNNVIQETQPVAQEPVNITETMNNQTINLDNNINSQPINLTSEVNSQGVNLTTDFNSQNVNVGNNVETPLIDTVSQEVIVPSFEGDNVIPSVSEVQNNEVKENSFIPNDLAGFEDVIVPPVENTVVNNPEVIPTETIKEEISFEIPEPIGQVEPRPIYGGADPLEATQTLPRMDVHHEPYSGGTKEVTVLPVEEKINIDLPVFEIKEEPTMPVIEEVRPVVEEVPSIITIPDEEIEEL